MCDNNDHTSHILTFSPYSWIAWDGLQRSYFNMMFGFEIFLARPCYLITYQRFMFASKLRSFMMTSRLVRYWSWMSAEENALKRHGELSLSQDESIIAMSWELLALSTLGSQQLLPTFDICWDKLISMPSHKQAFANPSILDCTIWLDILCLKSKICQISIMIWWIGTKKSVLWSYYKLTTWSVSCTDGMDNYLL